MRASFLVSFAAALVSLASSAGAQGVETLAPAELRAKVEALRAPDVAWRQIPWRTCLLEALAAAQAQQKPLLCWIFIDRPVDDARC